MYRQPQVNSQLEYDAMGNVINPYEAYSAGNGAYGNPYAEVGNTTPVNNYNTGSYYNQGQDSGYPNAYSATDNAYSENQYVYDRYADENAYRESNEFADASGNNGQDSVSGFGQTLKAGQAVANTYFAYKNLQETRKNNDRNYKLSVENNRRSAIRYQNKVNEKKRNAGLLTSNSNSSVATARVIARTPYRGY